MTARPSAGRSPSTPGHAGVEDPRLLARDGDDRRTENLRVLEFERRDHPDARPEYVRRVPSTSDAHLDHGGVHGRARKVIEREGRRALEEGRVPIDATLPVERPLGPEDPIEATDHLRG